MGAQDEHATEINLVEFTDPRTITGEGLHSEMNRVGLTRLALLVENVDEAFSAVGSYDGVQIVCAPKGIVIREPETTHVSRWFSFRDPFGVFIAVTESTESQAGEE